MDEYDGFKIEYTAWIREGGKIWAVIGKDKSWRRLVYGGTQNNIHCGGRYEPISEMVTKRMIARFSKEHPEIEELIEEHMRKLDKYAEDVGKKRGSFVCPKFMADEETTHKHT